MLKMLIVKIPAINGMGKTNGCEYAPDVLLEQLKDIYTNEQGKELGFRKEEVMLNRDDLNQNNNIIFNKAKGIFTNNPEFSLFLGGDHSISYSIVEAFNFCFNDSCLVVFDSHADCMNNFQPPTHEDWLRVLIEQGIKPENIILVGLRNTHPIELRYLASKKINYFSMKELATNMQECCDGIMELARKFNALYLSIDIDIVDPAFAPATGYIEPAGLTSRELIYFLQRIKLLKNLKAADIVEINPSKDINNMTCKLGAKIIAELIR
jgi:arginase family enzyme